MTKNPQDDLTAERAASGKSKRLIAHELLKEIVGIVPMQPEQRCRRIDLLLDYAKQTRQEALRDAARVADEYGAKEWDKGIQDAMARLSLRLDRLASEGAPSPIDLSPKFNDDGGYGEHF